MSTFEKVKEEKLEFEKNSDQHIYEKALLTFKGVDGMDVYNCSVPFKHNGQTHIFGRVEKRCEWANSFVRLFVETGKDEFTLVPDNMVWQLEDPFVSNIHNEMVFGGTHIRKTNNRVCTYYCDFFRGTAESMSYFTTGPDNMKDIRLVTLANNKIGVFSRPKTAAHAFIGFTVINNIMELTPTVVEEASPLNVIHAGAWGGVNQAYLLSSDKVGCISHYSYIDKDEHGNDIAVYTNYSFVLNPYIREVEDAKIIGTKGCYPKCSPKVDKLLDCAFTSGIVMREDGRCDLYSGLGDAYEGRITIDYPFEGHGTLIDNLNF
uniref:Uncharacterized protein n=2 Tax=Leishmania braziliensis species complex TaxID=37617 RepID=A0A0R6XXW7_LEIBR|nr:hypothetical protein [Leishmania braziliensis complex EV-2015]AKK31188.1 hypothetical protein [Leishmania braziliensis]CAJ2468547.1 unnamed protein product [Leishmania braziliensis]